MPPSDSFFKYKNQVLNHGSNSNQSGNSVNPSDGATANFPGYYPNLSAPVAYTTNSASGNNDIYTVPNDRKALVVDYTVTNSTGGSVEHYPQVKISGNYYRIGNLVTEGTTSTGIGHNYGMGSTRNSAPIVLNAGESFAINAAATGLSLWAHVLEFDSSSPLARAELTTFAAGNNTLLTVPTGKTILFGAPSFASNNNPGVSQVGLVYYNNSGGSRTLNAVYLVPNGSSPANNNKFAASNSIITGQGFNKFFFGGLAPGDSIVLDVDANTAGQFAWLNYTIF